MVTLSQLIKIMPDLKSGGFYFNILDEHYPLKSQWIWHTDFFNKYDCKKLQVIRCQRHWTYNDDYQNYELTLKAINDKPKKKTHIYCQHPDCVKYGTSNSCAGIECYEKN